MPRRVRRRRRGRAKTSGVKAMRMVKRLSRFVDTELHQQTLSVISTNITSGGGLTLLNTPGQGDDSFNRTGSKIMCRFISIRLILERTVADQMIRLVLLVDKQPNGAFPVLADIFENDGAAPQAVLSPYLVGNKKRFRILSDKTHQCMASDKPIRFVKINRRLSFPTTFIGTTAGIASMGTNALYLIKVADTDTGGAGIDVSFTSRFTFAP